MNKALSKNDDEERGFLKKFGFRSAKKMFDYLVVRTLGLKGGLLVARLLNRFTKAFSVVVSTLVELLTDGIGDLGGARGVGVVNGL